METKDISLIVLGIAFIGGLSAVEVMAGLYPDRVIYTIPAQTLSGSYQETKAPDGSIKKKCWEYCTYINGNK